MLHFTIHQRWLFAIRFLSVAGLLAVCGCKVGPNYQAPPRPTKVEWTYASHPRLCGDPVDPSQWWYVFQDPVLNGLIEQTLAQNLTLREAGKRIEEAAARRGVVAGNLYPQSQAMVGSYSKSRISANTANFFGFPGVFEPDLNVENWNIGLASSWELDFWGRYRRAIESADAALDATVAAYDEVSVLLAAEVANAYIELRTAELRSTYAAQNLEIQNRTLQIATRKQQAGIGTALDIAQAESIVAQTGSARPMLEMQRRLASNRLCLLLARTPEDLIAEIGYQSVIPKSPQQVAFEVPADLLRRRPDVRRAERELAAQSARIGVAEAEFYPHISLVGSIGYSAEDFSKLGRSTSSSGIISPQFGWNILNYGRIKRNKEAEVAAFQRLALAYEQSVLTAQREAEDAQLAFLFGFDRASYLERAVSNAKIAIDKLQQSYEAGTVEYGRIYVLQTELVQLQDLLAQTEASISGGLVAMYKALGGGWNSPCVERLGPMARTATRHR